MASNSFIPAPGLLFDSWQNQFVKTVNDHMADWDLPSRALTEWAKLTSPVNGKKKQWDEIWAIVSTKNCTKSQRAGMRQARKSYEFGVKTSPKDTSLRLFITRYIRNNPLVSIEQKSELGLTIPDTHKSPTSETLLDQLPRYIGEVVLARHMFHLSEIKSTVHKSKAKPAGVDSIQVFIAFTAATQKTQPEMSEFAYDGNVKYGKYRRRFQKDQEGLRAWYYVRLMLKGLKSAHGQPHSFWSSTIM